MQLKEIFDNPPKIEFEFDPDTALYQAKFKTKDDKQYQVDIVVPYMWGDDAVEQLQDFYNFTEKQWEKMMDDKSGAIIVSFEDNKGRTDTTNTGNSIEVFSAFYNVIQNYIKKNKPIALLYQALDPNRNNLYKKIFSKFSDYKAPELVNDEDGLFCSFKKGFNVKKL